jgi:hypothetical protein
MEISSHGLYYGEMKKPWGPAGSPMAPCYDIGRLRGMDEPCQRRRKSRKRNEANASYTLPSELYFLLAYFPEMSREQLELPQLLK